MRSSFRTTGLVLALLALVAVPVERALDPDPPKAPTAITADHVDHYDATNLTKTFLQGALGVGVITDVIASDPATYSRTYDLAVPTTVKREDQFSTDVVPNVLDLHRYERPRNFAQRGTQLRT